MKTRIFACTLLLAFAHFCAYAQVVNGRNFAIDGFAAYPGTPGTAHYHAGGTTGGEGGTVVYAATFGQLQAYLQSSNPYIILVDHDINTGITCYVESSSTGKLCDVQDGTQGVATTYGERILVASNKTLIGIPNAQGEAPTFQRITFVMQCTHNVIIRNCRFTMVGAPILKSGENKIVALRDGVQTEVGDPDCIGIQADAKSAKTDAGSHIWIDHCTFFNGDAANKDRYDGLLDCKNNVQWLTFSYNHFLHHDKACLWGKGDSDIFDGCRTISAHHNYFDSINGSRLPLQRGGHVHYMNNYQRSCADGWDVRTGAIGYADACYFRDSKAPIRLRGTEGKININQTEGFDIIFDGCDRIINGYTDLSATKHAELFPYNDTINHTSWLPTDTWAGYFVNAHDSTHLVPAICEQYSGAGKITIWEDVVPQGDWDEYMGAVKSASTGSTYQGGVKMTGNEQKPTSVDEIGASDTFQQGYNLLGLPVRSDYPGIIIYRGRKTLRIQ